MNQKHGFFSPKDQQCYIIDFMAELRPLLRQAGRESIDPKMENTANMYLCVYMYIYIYIILYVFLF